MPDTRLKVGVMFGGRSGEHDVSLTSAASVLKALKKEKYRVLPIGIDREGNWLNAEDSMELLICNNKLKPVEISESTFPEIVLDDEWIPIRIASGENSGPGIDVMLILLHGTYGEDGTMQGLLEIANVPYVGCGVLASSIAMDKISTKRMCEFLGLPVCRYYPVIIDEWSDNRKKCLDAIQEKLPYPIFVKPSNAGSSVGISKVKNESELIGAIEEAFRYDRRIIVEEGINGREIECSALGNEKPEISVPAEIIPHEEFYTYTSKYTSGGADVIIPAEIDPELTSKIQELTRQTFLAIDGSGMARVDFLLEHDTNAVYMSEINTIPGFTPLSAFSRMFEKSGVSYSELLDRLISLALERFNEKEKLLTEIRHDV